MSFVGKYERVSSKNYEEVLKALGVNFMLRKAATVSSPVMEISQNGDDWVIKTSTSLKTIELKFQLGKEFEETTADGRDVKAIVTLENGNILKSVQTAKKSSEKSTEVTRELQGDKIIQTMKVLGTDVVCVQEFKKV